jgi:mannose-6-phosphate isomerase-like protein (cupin superfamily)
MADAATPGSARRATVLLPGEARRIGAEGGPYVDVLAEATLTRGALTLMETGGTEVGVGPPMHIHHRDDEAFYVLAGRYRMHLAGRDFDCPAGSFIYVPNGTVHGFFAVEAGTRKLNVYAPSAFEGFFEDLDRLATAARDDAAIADLFERFATEVVGPIPDSYR